MSPFFREAGAGPPLEAFATLDVPVLYMIGGRSPPASRSVARLLTQVLPRVEVVEFEELGHMGPVTHPQVVNAAICEFLSRRDKTTIVRVTPRADIFTPAAP